MGGSRSRLKACDPFCTRKPIYDRHANSEKKYNKGKDEKVPKSLQFIIDAQKLVQAIDNKKKIKQSQEEQNRIANAKRKEEEAKNPQPELNPSQLTNRASTTSKKKKKLDAKKLKQSEKNRIQKNKILGNEKENQIAPKKTAQVTEQKQKELEAKTDYTEEETKLKQLIGIGADLVDKYEDEEDERKNSNSTFIETKRKKGESRMQHRQRMVKEREEFEKKSTNTYQKKKEHKKLKELKQKLAKKGLKIEPMLKKNGKPIKPRKDALNKDSDDEKDLDQAVDEYLEKEKSRKALDFNELKDNFKFGEQAYAPPQLPVLKDLSAKSKVPVVKSSKRKYIWQDEEGNEQTKEEYEQHQLELKKLEIIKKQKMDLMRDQVVKNYKEAKSRKKQLEMMNKEQ